MTFLSHVLAGIRQHAARHAAVRELQSLPTFVLADLGFADEQIPDVVEDLLLQSATPKRRGEGVTGQASFAAVRNAHI